jgi:hypothetical protein|tara:strand:+ start:849 stop:1079 length:231 start_codon:yes stop_codon:yes gene_type:complete
MVTYNLINKLKELGLLEECINKGVVSFKYPIWVDLYDFYIHQLTIEPSRMQCITNTADKFSYSDNMTRYIIKTMEN